MDIRGRRSIRLRGWDYSSPGLYFVTLCVQGRESFFGEIANSKMILSPSGMMINQTWSGMGIHFPDLITDQFVVMPNHVHGILGLHVGAGLRACPSEIATLLGQGDPGRTQRSAPTESRLSLYNIIRQFKTWTTNLYSKNVFLNNWPEFHKRLWQRNYYEHIIRNENELQQTREYIRNNPADWEIDDEKPNMFL
ncbi:MAG: transposase [Candidatus Aminicenantes bacterium]|nr:transposase [Candidatus Aminicenantes bacterium]